MRRREFIVGTFATSAMGFAQPICAQTNGSALVTKRIAIVHPTEKPEGLTVNGRQGYRVFFGELNKRGFVEGHNLVVERFSALGRSDGYENVARAAVESQPDLIICFGTPLALRLKSLTATIPIVTTTADPIAAGLVTSLARPDRNITGVSVDAGIELWGKRFQLLREVTRGRLANVRFLFTNTAILWESTAASVREAAQRTGASISAALLGSSVDQAAYERVFDGMDSERVDGLIVYDAAEHLTNRELIVDLAAKHRLPAIYPFREFVEVGGLLSYGVDTAELTRRLADMTDRVLRGAKPEDIPLYQLAKFDLTLNRKTAASLGLEFPASLLAVADEVIE